VHGWLDGPGRSPRQEGSLLVAGTICGREPTKERQNPNNTTSEQKDTASLL